MAFDTDLIGVGGYSVDISRTWTVERPPSDEHRRLFDAAYEQLRHNTDLLRPGASFAEISLASHLPPTDLQSEANAAVAHGIGLCNEYPLILNRELFAVGTNLTQNKDPLPTAVDLGEIHEREAKAGWSSVECASSTSTMLPGITTASWTRAFPSTA